MSALFIVFKRVTRLIAININSRDLDMDVENYIIFRCESDFFVSVDLFPLLKNLKNRKRNSKFKETKLSQDRKRNRNFGNKFVNTKMKL